MVLAACRAVLHIPDAQSLKDKRQVVQGLVRKLRDRHNASVLELEGRDLWQKVELGIALAARDRADAELRAGRVRGDIETLTGLKEIDFEVEYR